MKLPGPDHPITIARNANRVRVIFAGQVIADTTRALTLTEAGYAPVQYISARRRCHEPAQAAPRMPAIARTRATPAISRSSQAGPRPTTQCGATSSLSRRWPRLPAIWRSIRTAWTKSRKAKRDWAHATIWQSCLCSVLASGARHRPWTAKPHSIGNWSRSASRSPLSASISAWSVSRWCGRRAVSTGQSGWLWRSRWYSRPPACR